MDPLLTHAERHHGTLTRETARTAGITDDSVNARLRRDFEVVARGVYRVVGSVPTWHQSLYAGVLAAGEDGLAADESGAALYRIPGFPPGPIVVIRPRQTHHRGLIGTVHETTTDLRSEARVVDGIPVASPALTLLGLCASDKWGLRSARAMDNAISMRLVTVPKLATFYAKWGGRGRPGSRLFRKLLEERGGDYTPTASELEELTTTTLAAAGLPQPERQIKLGSDKREIGRVDFFYRPRVVIEAQSLRHHTSFLDRQSDEKRILELTAAGFQVIEVSWHRLVHEPNVFIAAVRSALERNA